MHTISKGNKTNSVPHLLKTNISLCKEHSNTQPLLILMFVASDEYRIFNLPNTHVVFRFRLHTTRNG